MKNLTIKFKTQEKLEIFIKWLCDCGEQEYWNYADNFDEELVVQSFDYDFENDIINESNTKN